MSEDVEKVELVTLPTGSVFTTGSGSRGLIVRWRRDFPEGAGRTGGRKVEALALLIRPDGTWSRRFLRADLVVQIASAHAWVNRRGGDPETAWHTDGVTVGRDQRRFAVPRQRGYPRSRTFRLAGVA